MPVLPMGLLPIHPLDRANKAPLHRIEPSWFAFARKDTPPPSVQIGLRGWVQFENCLTDELRTAGIGAR